MRNNKGQFVKGMEPHNKKWFGVCKIKGCERTDMKAWGMCHKHYKTMQSRRRNGQDFSDEALARRLPRTEEHAYNNAVCRVGKSNSLKGKTFLEIYGDRAEERLRNLRESLKGVGKGRVSPLRGIKTGKPAWNKGKKHLPLEKNPAWKGGKSFESYGREFNRELKEYIRRRENFKCFECGIPEIEIGHALSVHHIDENKKNNAKDNLVALCKKCHAKAHFTSGNWKEYFYKEIKENENARTSNLLGRNIASGK